MKKRTARQAVMLALVLFLLSGCGKRQEEKQQGDALETESAAQEKRGEKETDEPEETEKSLTETERMTQKQENQGEQLTETEKTPSNEGPVPEIAEDILTAREAMGEVWAVSMEKLDTGESFSYQGDRQMQSASVIKVFIMGAVYDRICYPSSEKEAIVYQESAEGELKSLLTQMITVSDNDAANRLVEILGEGDFERGRQVVNEFCQAQGYQDTSLGRRFLDTDPKGDNVTSADDCRRILADIYRGKLVSREASGKMLELLKGQTQKGKIPAGLPEGFSSANKTGEMPEGYGLGCIENDMAIVFSPYGDYVLVVLSNELGGKNSEAQKIIAQISSLTASKLR